MTALARKAERRWAPLLLALVVITSCVRGPAAPVPATPDPRFDWFAYDGSDSVYKTIAAGPDDYRNPILGGFYPDPSMVRVKDDYYLVNSSFAYFPGVPIFHSRDLVHWTQLGNVLSRRSQLDLDGAGISRGIYAPSIRYHDGVFYMITTLMDKGGNFFVTATNPAGPWSDPVWLPSVDGIDPSLFFDDDGKAYVVNNGEAIEKPRYNGHRAIWIQEFDVKAQQMIGPRTLIVNGGVDITTNPIWIEGPHLFRKNGQYYLLCAEGGTGDGHSEVVFRSDAIRGPYLPGPSNPVLTQRNLAESRPFPITSTGHADFVELPNGDWWSVFLGTRPYAGDMYNTGRETYLMPVRWVNGWPVMTAGTETVPYVRRRPDLAGDAPGPMPLGGNLSYRDDFDGPSLAPGWQLIRTPKEQWYDLTSTRGALTLHARSADFSPRDQPSFLGRRQQNLLATASTAMTYAPAKNGDRAGLVAFQNDEFYYLLAVTRAGDERVLQLEKRAGSAPATVVATTPLHGDPNAPVYLRIQAKGARYDFFFATTPDAWTLLAGDADGTILSTKVAGGFVGTMFGLYAHSR